MKEILIISFVDKEVSDTLLKRICRKRETESFYNSQKQQHKLDIVEFDSDSSDSSGKDDEEYVPPKTSFKRVNKEPTNMKVKKNKDIPSFAEACDRAQVSDRAAALLSTSFLEDYSMVTRENR